MFMYIINISMMYKNYVSYWGKILVILGGKIWYLNDVDYCIMIIFVFYMSMK